MKEYHKIQTVFLRDPATGHKYVMEGQYARPEFEYLANNVWVFTEKVDGTNIRVGWDGTTIHIGGKTDRADTPAVLQTRLTEIFADKSKFENVFGNQTMVTLYGEGYGAKVQKGGGKYIPDGTDFILFDVNIDDIWLERKNVEDIAAKLGLKVVPIIGAGTLNDAVELVRQGLPSRLGKLTAEGLVLRPKVELFDRRGQRVIAKIKHKDFLQNSRQTL